MDQLLGYFGLSASVSPEEQNKGKRRTVLYLTFVSFVLFAAACASTDWILGGLEFGDQSVPNSQAHFHVSLTSVQVEAYIIDPWLSSANVNNPVTYNNVNTYKRSDYLARAAILNNFVATANNLLPGYVPNPNHANGACVRGENDFTTALGQGGPVNWFCGSGVTNKMNAKIDDAYGLMVVSALLGGVAWVLVTMVAQGSTALVGRKFAYEGVAITMVASAFFALCSVSVFADSGLKNSFCSVFDPDANDGVYCGYYDGFFAAIAGIVMMLITAGLFWFWMPHDTSGSGASYAFTEVGVKSAGFTEFGASGAPEPTAPAAAVGGYQGFGSEAAL